MISSTANPFEAAIYHSLTFCHNVKVNLNPISNDFHPLLFSLGTQKRQKEGRKVEPLTHPFFSFLSISMYIFTSNVVPSHTQETFSTPKKLFHFHLNSLCAIYPQHSIGTIHKAHIKCFNHFLILFFTSSYYYYYSSFCYGAIKKAALCYVI